MRLPLSRARPEELGLGEVVSDGALMRCGMTAYQGGPRIEIALKLGPPLLLQFYLNSKWHTSPKQ